MYACKNDTAEDKEEMEVDRERVSKRGGRETFFMLLLNIEFGIKTRTKEIRKEISETLWEIQRGGEKERQIYLFIC